MKDKQEIIKEAYSLIKNNKLFAPIILFIYLISLTMMVFIYMGLYSIIEALKLIGDINNYPIDTLINLYLPHILKIIFIFLILIILNSIFKSSIYGYLSNIIENKIIVKSGIFNKLIGIISSFKFNNFIVVFTSSLINSIILFILSIILLSLTPMPGDLSVLFLQFILYLIFSFITIIIIGFITSLNFILSFFIYNKYNKGVFYSIIQSFVLMNGNKMKLIPLIISKPAPYMYAIQTIFLRDILDNYERNNNIK